MHLMTDPEPDKALSNWPNKQYISNTKNAPSPRNKRDEDYKERIKIEVLIRCRLTETETISVPQSPPIGTNCSKLFALRLLTHK